MKPFIKNGTASDPLRGRSVFSRVYPDEYKAVLWDKDSSVDSREVWNNKIDICSDACYVDSTSL